jgi:hypothetical protein
VLSARANGVKQITPSGEAVPDRLSQGSSNAQARGHANNEPGGFDVALTTARPGTHTRNTAATAAILFFAIVALLFGVRDARAAVGGATGSLASTGPVAAYNFDAGSGTTVADLSGNANTGTITGATWVTTGKNGGGLSFNGTSNYVQVADSASLDLTTGMTLEAWVNPSALGTTWRTVLFKAQGSNMVYSLYANQDTTRPVGQVNIGGEKNAVGTAALALNTWSHIAVTYDGSALRLYVNGALAATTAVSGTIPVSSGVLRMGGNAQWGEWFGGLLDDVRIYNRSLSAGEIATDMNRPVS